MSRSATQLSRRTFVKLTLATGAILPAQTLLGGGRAEAADLPHLDESDQAAQALKYVHDASQVDEGMRGGADRVCRGCRFFTEPSSEEWGPCTLFPGKAVNASGWCSGWVAKTG